MISMTGMLDLDIGRITFDSREVQEGDLFVAVPGTRVDGHKFIHKAVAAGAVAVAAQEAQGEDYPQVTWITVSDSQKALAHAALVTKEEGTIILAAACPEGTGSQSYEQWMEGMTSYEAVFQRFQGEEFRLGPHKAFQIARDAAQARVLLVSQMPPDLVRRLLLIPAEGFDGAMDVVRDSLPTRMRVGVMPYANATIPIY